MPTGSHLFFFSLFLQCERSKLISFLQTSLLCKYNEFFFTCICVFAIHVFCSFLLLRSSSRVNLKHVFDHRFTYMKETLQRMKMEKKRIHAYHWNFHFTSIAVSLPCMNVCIETI